MRKMRIAVNARFLLKGKLEGIGWFTYEVLRELVQMRPNDEFIFFFDRPYDESFVFAANIKPVVLQPPARHPLLFIAWFEWSVTRALKHYKADIFFSPDNFCSLRTEVPTLLVIHDLAYVHFPEQVSRGVLAYYRYFMPRFLQKANHIITVSEYTKQDILANFNIPNHKISVACNGVRPTFQPLEDFKKQAIRDQYADSKGYFFYVGAVHPRKNIPRLIAAFDQFKSKTNSDIQLLIAGRFSWKTGEVKNAYEATQSQEDIQFLGYVSDEELPKLVGASTALTYVSLFEGFGVPLLEAMHCDVPILTSNVSSMPEVVGEAGVLVNPESVGEIADAMQQLTDNQALRDQLVHNARSQREAFSWKIAAEVVAKGLEKIAVHRS